MSAGISGVSVVIVGALQATTHTASVAVGSAAAAARHNSASVERGRIDTYIRGTAAATALAVVARKGMNTAIAAAVPAARIGGAYGCGGHRVFTPAADKHIQCIALVYRQITFGVAALAASVEGSAVLCTATALRAPSLQVQLVDTCGNNINLSVAGEGETHGGIFAIVCCGSRRHNISRSNTLSLGCIVVPVVSSRQINGVAQADNRLVADSDGNLGVGYLTETVGIAEREYAVLHTGVGIDRNVNNIRIGHTFGVVACDAITERSSARKGDMQIFATSVALVDNRAAQSCRGKRINRNGKRGVVCAIVCGCYRGSHFWRGNGLCKSLIGVPCTRGQSRGVASAYHRLVADHNVEHIACHNGVAARSVGEVGDAETRACCGTQAYSVAVGVGNTVVVVACDTIVEGCGTSEGNHHFGIVAATDIPRGILDGYRRSGIYDYLVRNSDKTRTACTTAYCYNTSVAVALVTSLVASTCHIGECHVSSYGLSIIKIVTIIKQTSGGIVTCCGRSVNIS